MTATEKPQLSDSQEVPRTSALRGPRWWPALVILALVALGIAYIFLFSGLGPGWRFWASVGTMFLGIAALMLWVIAFSRLPWKWRLAGFFAPIILIGGFGFGYAQGWYWFAEFDGNSVPVFSSFTWGWNLRPAERMAEVMVPIPPADVRVVPSPHDYPQFQGPRRDGIVRGVKLARDWKAHPPRQVWRREIGAGWSGFAVVGDYAFTQELRGAVEVVACYRLTTGEPVWVHQDEEGYQ